MTNITFQFKNKRTIKDILVGTILKKQHSMYIVIQIFDDNLCGESGLYTLVNLKTGINLYHLRSLNDLIKKIEQDGDFEIVDHVEIKELE